MEDEYFVSEGGRFAAVFDGHGGNGVSRYLRENLYKHIRYYLYEESEEDYYSATSIHPSNNLSQPKDVSFDSRCTVPSIAHHIAALRSAFRSVEREVISREHFQHVGSTAVAIMLHESENGSRTLISANIGDSRAVLSRRGKAINLTRDHKPNDEKEKARIMSLGETVEWDPYSEVYRVCNLSLSRAIGDSYAKPYVSSEVEIKRLPLGDDGADEFVVLASDGLWDVMESEEVVHFVHQVLRAPVPLDENSAMTTKMRRRQMSRMLSNEAIRRGTGDNVCVIVVWLDKIE
jgi:serine/threonine protein phosphatase PrpC